MSYTGAVDRWRASDARILPHLMIRKACVGPDEHNAYLLTCASTGGQVLIDPGPDLAEQQRLIRDGHQDGRLDWIILTHRHPETPRWAMELRLRTGAFIASGIDDAPLISVPSARTLAHGEVLSFGRATLLTIRIRGAATGSIALYHRAALPAADAPDSAAHATTLSDSTPSRHLFCGDTLRRGHIGHARSLSTLPQLVTDLHDKVFAPLPDDTWIYPAHGADTTVGHERDHIDDTRRALMTVRRR